MRIGWMVSIIFVQEQCTSKNNDCFKALYQNHECIHYITNIAQHETDDGVLKKIHNAMTEVGVQKLLSSF